MKVGIVGAGFVGATAGYALVMQGVGREVVLVDKNVARAEAQADDLRHAVPFAHPLEIRAGGYEVLEECRVVLLCAGVASTHNTFTRTLSASMAIRKCSPGR
jgi:L-lactate dehydrogenase